MDSGYWHTELSLVKEKKTTPKKTEHHLALYLQSASVYQT